MRWQPPTPVASCHLLYWLFKFRWGHHADIDVLRSSLPTDCTHLLLLHRFSPNTPLAADNNRVIVPSL